MVGTLYVARHGLRANADPPPTGIDSDPSLTDEGRVQAEELAAFVSATASQKGKPITAIYSSPFYRCVETATPVSRKLGVPIFIERGLSEHYLPTRRTKPVPLTAAMSKERFFPDVDTSYQSQVPVSTAGETREELRERVTKALSVVLQHAEDHGHENILVLTHAAIKIIIARVLTGETVRAGTCSLDQMERAEPNGSHEWRLTVGGDTHFLSGGEQMHWSFDMAVEAGSAADEALRASTKSLPRATPVEENQSEPEKAKFLVSLDTSGLAAEDQPATLDPEQMHFVNMDTARPLIQLGDKVYEGEWQSVVGTEVYTSPEGQPVGSARTRIKLRRAETEQPPRDRRPLLERLQ